MQLRGIYKGIPCGFTFHLADTGVVLFVYTGKGG